jgi:hypothetical protein
LELSSRKQEDVNSLIYKAFYVYGASINIESGRRGMKTIEFKRLVVQSDVILR